MKKDLSSAAVVAIISGFVVLAIAAGWLYVSKATSFSGNSGKPNPTTMGTPKAPPPPPPSGFPKP